MDNIFGAILSQAIFVPFTAIFLTALSLGWKAKWLASLYFALIENLFLRLDVYRHKWWKTVYSFIIFPFYFRLSDYWYLQLQKGNKLTEFFSLFFMTFVTRINILFTQTIKRKVLFGIGMHHSWNEHFIFAPLYSLVQSLLSTILLTFKNKWPAWIGMLVFSIGFDNILKKVNIVKNGFQKRSVNNAIRVGIILLASLYRKWICDQK